MDFATDVNLYEELSLYTLHKRPKKFQLASEDIMLTDGLVFPNDLFDINVKDLYRPEKSLEDTNINIKEIIDDIIEDSVGLF